MNRDQALDTLGLSPSATKSEVKAQYKKLAHKYHPDKPGGDEGKFIKIQEAFRFLEEGTPLASAAIQVSNDRQSSSGYEEHYDSICRRTFKVDGHDLENKVQKAIDSAIDQADDESAPKELVALLVGFAVAIRNAWLTGSANLTVLIIDILLAAVALIIFGLKLQSVMRKQSRRKKGQIPSSPYTPRDVCEDLVQQHNMREDKINAKR